jgi:hypothetical protein
LKGSLEPSREGILRRVSGATAKVAFTALTFVSRIRKTPCSGGQTQQKNVTVLPLGQEDSRGCTAQTLPKRSCREDEMANRVRMKAAILQTAIRRPHFNAAARAVLAGDFPERVFFLTKTSVR